jgi:hypothetical protein
MKDPTEGLPSNETLRRAFALTSEGARSRSDCPPEERLWEAVHGLRSPEEIRAVVDHVALCGACVEGWRLARELARPTGASVRGEAPRFPAASRWGAPFRSRAAAWGLGAAAAATILLAGIALWREQRQTPAPVMRAGADAVLRSLVPESQPLPRGKFLLMWSSAGEGATYDLYVVTEDLQHVASARGITATEYLVAEKDLSALPAGATVVWRVSARLPDGRGMTSASFLQKLE